MKREACSAGLRTWNRSLLEKSARKAARLAAKGMNRTHAAQLAQRSFEEAIL